MTSSMYLLSIKFTWHFWSNFRIHVRWKKSNFKRTFEQNI